MWNVSTVPGWPQLIPKSLHFIGNTLEIHQNWAMFVNAKVDDGWFVDVSHFGGDRSKSILFKNQPTEPTLEQPLRIAQTFPNDRWKKYLYNIYLVDHHMHRPQLARYFCDSHNDKKGIRGTRDFMTRFELSFMRYETRPYPRLATNKMAPEKIDLIQFKCN